MRALTYSAFGPAHDVLRLCPWPDPVAQPGEVVVRMHFSAVNPSDVRARAGGRPGVTKPPFETIIPHSDGSGIIEKVGAGVDKARIGERVWIWNGQWQRPFGTAAELITLPSEQAVALPDQTSLQEGAVLGIPGLTACHAVLGHGPVAGKKLLISGGGGSVGYLAVQMAAHSGAEIIATASSADHDKVRAAGAAHVLDYRDDNLADAVLDAAGGPVIDRVIEVEFGQNIEMIAQVIATGGTIAAFGSAKNMTPTLPFYPLMFKAVTLEMMLIYLLSPVVRQKRLGQLTNFLEKDGLDIPISDILPLEDGADAHDLIATGQRKGAVLLSI